MISAVALDEFKAIWLAEFGEELPDDVVMDEAIAVLTAVDTTYRPVPKAWWDAKNENETYLDDTEA